MNISNLLLVTVLVFNISSLFPMIDCDFGGMFPDKNIELKNDNDVLLKNFFDKIWNSRMCFKDLDFYANEIMLCKKDDLKKIVKYREQILQIIFLIMNLDFNELKKEIVLMQKNIPSNFVKTRCLLDTLLSELVLIHKKEL